jgi:hypothetical protein
MKRDLSKPLAPTFPEPKISKKQYEAVSLMGDKSKKSSDLYFTDKASKRQKAGMAKLAAGTAATAASMYYGLTKKVGGHEHKDAQGNVTGKTKSRRVPIWSKDKGF